MAAPTVAVTVDLAALGGVAVEGLTIRCKLDQNDAYNGEFVLAGTQSAVTDVNGVAVFNLFPNEPAPAGLGTTGSVYRFTARRNGARVLDETVQIPNHACNLSDLTGAAVTPGSGLAGLLSSPSGAGLVGLGSGTVADALAPAGLNVLLTAWLASLPTSLPGTPGQFWLDGGVIAVS
jgi:hypothetical protein